VHQRQNEKRKIAGTDRVCLGASKKPQVRRGNLWACAAIALVDHFANSLISAYSTFYKIMPFNFTNITIVRFENSKRTSKVGHRDTSITGGNAKPLRLPYVCGGKHAGQVVFLAKKRKKLEETLLFQKVSQE
jgi:hypothetical protein